MATIKRNSMLYRVGTLMQGILFEDELAYSWNNSNNKKSL